VGSGHGTHHETCGYDKLENNGKKVAGKMLIFHTLRLSARKFIQFLLPERIIGLFS
jgi:hypothetical protein